jgi:Co/Zn/Cd efflux system component
LLLLVPAISVIISTIYKINNPTVPSGSAITTVAFGALVMNFICALLLVKFRENQQSLVIAAYLSARNDALANLAMITAGIITVFWLSPVPDLIVGITIGMSNANAALKVWQSTEH